MNEDTGKLIVILRKKLKPEIPSVCVAGSKDGLGLYQCLWPLNSIDVKAETPHVKSPTIEKHCSSI